MYGLNVFLLGEIMETKPIFVLGVGAQKAGTTWLHKLLTRQNGANFGPLKEYHFLTKIDNSPTLLHFLSSLKKRLRGITKHSPLTASGIKSYDIYRYVRFFKTLVSNDSARLTGDITPAYAFVSADTFQKVATKLRAEGFLIRVIFLMRDPVERCWSASKMHYNNPEIFFTKKELELNFSEIEYLLMKYAESSFRARTEYQHTVNTLRTVFTDEEIFISLFEEFFTDDSINALSRFLGIELINVNLDDRINTSSKQISVPEEIQKSIALKYKDTYAFCEEEFGSERIRRLWPSRRYLELKGLHRIT
jgi:hypothetical protein